MTLSNISWRCRVSIDVAKYLLTLLNISWLCRVSIDVVKNIFDVVEHLMTLPNILWHCRLALMTLPSILYCYQLSYNDLTFMALIKPQLSTYKCFGSVCTKLFQFRCWWWCISIWATVLYTLEDVHVKNCWKKTHMYRTYIPFQIHTCVLLRFYNYVAVTSFKQINL